jgi:hypothetical protein
VGGGGAESRQDAPPQGQGQHCVRGVDHEQDVPHEPLLRKEVQARHYEAWAVNEHVFECGGMTYMTAFLPRREVRLHSRVRCPSRLLTLSLSLSLSRSRLDNAFFILAFSHGIRKDFVLCMSDIVRAIY